MLSGENRKVSTIGLDVSDKLNLNPYKFVKVGFEGSVSGTIDLSLITENQTKTYQQTLSVDSAIIEIADAVSYGVDANGRQVVSSKPNYKSMIITTEVQATEFAHGMIVNASKYYVGHTFTFLAGKAKLYLRVYDIQFK